MEMDSILVTNLPNMLLEEQKGLVLGHFANFGTILRISCAMAKKRERQAHIQYSSVGEAENAFQNGKNMGGHRLTVNLTSRHPTTQLLKVRPTPTPSTLRVEAALPSRALSSPRPPTLSPPHLGASGSSMTPSPSPSPPPTGIQQQSTLDAFILGSPPTPPPPSVQSVGGPTTSFVPEPVAGPSNGIRSPFVEPERMPNPCVKMELYKRQSLGTGLAATASTATSTPPPVYGQNARLHMDPQLAASLPNLSRPERSFRELFKFDLPRMRVIKNHCQPSNALACQLLSRGTATENHPIFPIALMFGRHPGTIIMPVKSLMDEIKPGLKIEQSSVDLIWNSILTSVLKEEITDAAKKNLRLEKKLRNFDLPNWMETFLDECITQIITETAEKEMEKSEELGIIFEEVEDNILNEICLKTVQESAAQQLKLQRIEKVSQSYVEDVTEEVVNQNVAESARDQFLTSHCEEVIEDLLECNFIDKCVEFLANRVLKKERVYDELITAHCQEVVDEFINDTDFIDQCVGAIAKAAINKCKEEENESSSSDESSLDLGLPSNDVNLSVSNWIDSMPDRRTPSDSDYASSISSSSVYEPTSSNASSQSMDETSDQDGQNDYGKSEEEPEAMQNPGLLGSFRAIKRKAVSFCQNAFKKIRRW